MSVRPPPPARHTGQSRVESNQAQCRARALATASLQEPRPVRLFEVNRFSAGTVIPLLQRELRRIGFQSDEVVVRSFSRDRLDQALQTGTDRTADSNLFVEPNGAFPSADCAPAVRAAAGVGAERVIFANRVAWRDARPQLLTSIPGTHQTDATPWERSPDFSPEFSAETVLAVYDPSKLRPAPDSTVEYWFDGPPKDALLFLVAEPSAHVEARHDQLRAEHDKALKQLGLDTLLDGFDTPDAST